MSAQHDAFLERYRASSDAVFIWARYLHEQGRWIEIPPRREAPTAADAWEYADNGDLFVLDGAGSRKEINVKGLSAVFTGPYDWPFKDEVFVSGRDDIDRRPDTVAYVFLSLNRCYAGIIDAEKTRHTWYVTEKPNGLTGGNICAYYACPKAVVTWKRIG